jgi:hypothetical protein
MAATMRGVEAIEAERAAYRQSRAYHAALKRALASSKAYARAGGSLAIPIAPLERVVKLAAKWRAGFSEALPRGAIAKRQATASRGRQGVEGFDADTKSARHFPRSENGRRCGHEGCGGVPWLTSSNFPRPPRVRNTAAVGPGGPGLL